MEQIRPLLPGGQRRLAAGRIRGANSRGDREAVASCMEQTQRELATVALVSWEVGVAGPEAESAHSEAKARPPDAADPAMGRYGLLPTPHVRGNEP